MKILVIFTGGTIGSTEQDGWISPNQATKYLLLKEYTEKHSEVDFETIEPYTILSENLSAEALNTLLQSVCENAEKEYDGIIITHGTDTLQYSASALSYAFGDTGMPIVLVSSNYPLSDAKSNGYINFEAAVQFIQSRIGKGVFVCYANTPARVEIHCGNMLLSHSEMSDALYSVGSNEFAYYQNGNIVLNPHFKKPIFNKPLRTFTLKPHPDILVVNNYPGEKYPYVLDGYRAVILRPYHSGTLNTDNTHLRELCQKAKAKGIPVFIVNVNNGAAYASSKLYSELGIIVLPQSAFVSIYMKIWIAVSNAYDITTFIKEPLAGEFY